MTRYNSNLASRPDQVWRNMLDASLESGQNPTITLGAGRELLGNLPVVVALHAFAKARHDVTTPTVVVAGDALLWLLALMQESQQLPAPAPAMNIVYGGPDPAIQIAAIDSIIPAGQGYSSAPAHGISTGYAVLLAPTLHAGVMLWEALPLALIRTGRIANEDNWLTWAGALVALGLILLSLAY